MEGLAVVLIKAYVALGEFYMVIWWIYVLLINVYVVIK